MKHEAKSNYNSTERQLPIKNLQMNNFRKASREMIINEETDNDQ